MRLRALADPLWPAAHGFLERIGTVVVGLSEENDVTGAYAEFFRVHDIYRLLARPDFAVFGVARRIDQFGALVSSLKRAVLPTAG